MGLPANIHAHPHNPRCAARWCTNDLILSWRNRGRGAIAACCVAPCWIDSSSCKKMHNVKTCLLRCRLAKNDSYLPLPARLKRHKLRRPPRLGREDEPRRKHILQHKLFCIKVCNFQTSFQSPLLWRNRALRPVLSSQFYQARFWWTLLSKSVSDSKCCIPQTDSIWSNETCSDKKISGMRGKSTSLPTVKVMSHLKTTFPYEIFSRESSLFLKLHEIQGKHFFIGKMVIKCWHHCPTVNSF